MTTCAAICDGGAALAQIAVQAIIERRDTALANEGVHQQPGSMAYILRSLKHQDEVEALRKLYGPRFILIGAHAPRNLRIETLARDIAASYASTDTARYKEKAEQLAHRDESEEGHDYGQHVRETFPLADFFVNVHQRHDAKLNLDRFLNAYFGWPFASPTRDEYGMFHAQAASARSADLSRQVGAAVATEEGDIIAVGCNEVPRFGGGAYWEGDPDDARDFQRGSDPNQRMRDVIINEIRQVLSDKWLAESMKAASLEEFRDALGDARVQQLTEFNRAVHAEMAALLDGARRGVSVRGATLYTTTFPCHNCAKHIVAAGIRRVVYIAPYAKSLAEELHPDTVAIDSDHPVEGKVAFDRFVGVSPDVYLPIFTKGDARRKDKKTGKVVDFNPLVASPKLVPQGDFAYLDRERLALRTLQDALMKSQQRREVGEGDEVRFVESVASLLSELAARDPEDQESANADETDEANPPNTEAGVSRGLTETELENSG